MKSICPLAALHACPGGECATTHCRHSEAHETDSRCTENCPLADTAGMEARCVPLEVDPCPDK